MRGIMTYLLGRGNVGHQENLGTPTERLSYEPCQGRASVGNKLSIRPSGAKVREYLHK